MMTDDQLHEIHQLSLTHTTPEQFNTTILLLLGEVRRLNGIVQEHEENEPWPEQRTGSFQWLTNHDRKYPNSRILTGPPRTPPRHSPVWRSLSVDELTAMGVVGIYIGLSPDDEAPEGFHEGMPSWRADRETTNPTTKPSGRFAWIADRVRAMTPSQFRSSLKRAGIVGDDGELMEKYKGGEGK